MLFSCDFARGPVPDGWRWTPSENPGGLRFVASEGWYPDKGGVLRSPPIAVGDPALLFYRLRFTARTGQRGYWAMHFQDAAGADLVDDSYAAIDRSGGPLAYEAVVRRRDGAATFTVTFQGQAPITVSDLIVDQVSTTDAAAIADRLYAALPPLSWTPPAGRWAQLPRTRQLLGSGGGLRVVQLGDSIVNDTNNGNWDALVNRARPGAGLQAVTSVRGSTGCWYYRDPGQFAAYVAAKRPDLLLIGGISQQRADVDATQALAAIREVALRARDAIGCEVVLMSGPMGKDWRSHDPATPDAPLPAQTPPDAPALYQEMAALTTASGLAYIDCHAAWHRYLGASQRPWQWFHRDEVHANDRGKQILARILERWFAD